MEAAAADRASFGLSVSEGEPAEIVGDRVTTRFLLKREDRTGQCRIKCLGEPLKIIPALIWVAFSYLYSLEDLGPLERKKIDKCLLYEYCTILSKV